MRRRLLFSGLVVVVFLGAGCGRGSFIGKRLDNFSAYYNTFYNAEKALEEGVEAFSTGQREQPIDQNVYLSLFGVTGAATTQRKPFEDAILKCADILREHPDSKWVDDAVLVIGQAWFYTQNYVGAEEKFREILTLESRLHDEARFWLARTLIASGQYDAAFDHLQESINREDLSRRWEPKLRLALAELHVQRQDWSAAAADLEAGLEGVRDKALAARAQFLLGQVYETLGRYDDAVAAYDRVRAYNPFYELSYAAQYSAVRVESEHGNPDQAMARLRRMERDDKNYDHRAALAYLRGRVLQASGRYEDALDVYYELLYDPTANATSVRGQTHYALGVFYRDVYKDFPYAAAYFDTARTNLTRPASSAGFSGAGSARQTVYAPGAIKDSEEQARTFLSFAEVMDRVSLMDSLLYLGSLDDSTFEAVVLDLRRRRAEELEAQRRQMERLQAERQFQQVGSNTFDSGFGRTPQGKQVTNTPMDQSAGFLFHRDAVRVQEALADFTLRWGNRPLVPNWRRLDAATGVVAQRSTIDSLLTEGQATSGSDLPEVDVSGVPRDSLSQHKMKARRAVGRYELANVLFLSMNRPDSAAAWYRMVIEEDSDEPVAQRAYYALAEVQRALGDTLAAQRLYTTIIDRYPDSDFSEIAYERLGLQPADDAVSDTLTLAEAAYDQAYATWKRQHYQESLDDMVALAINYGNTEVAPRALFAAGSVYMEWATRDSLDLFDVLPLTMPDSVLYASDLFRPRAAPPSGQPPVTTGATRPGDVSATPTESPLKRTDTPLKQTDTPLKQTDTPLKRTDAPVKQTDTPVKQIDLEDGRIDSLAVQDGRIDSLAVQADSLAMTDRAHTDSTTIIPDSTTITPDSTVVLEPEPVRLETLYASLRARYPQAPQADPAGRILEALKERREALQALADSLAADSLAADSLAAMAAVAAADTLAADSLAQVVAEGELPVQPGARADSSAGKQEKDKLLGLLDQRRERAQRGRPPVPVDTVAVDTVAVDTVAVDTVAAGASATPGAPGLGNIDWAQGGWTIYVHTEEDLESAKAFARNFGNYVRTMNLSVDVYAALVRQKTEYRIGVGLFASEAEAQEAFARVKDRMPNEARVVQVPKTP